MSHHWAVLARAREPPATWTIVCVFVIPRPRKDWHAVRRQRIAELPSQTNPRATTSCIGGAIITV